MNTQLAEKSARARRWAKVKALEGCLPLLLAIGAYIAACGDGSTDNPLAPGDTGSGGDGSESDAPVRIVSVSSDSLLSGAVTLTWSQYRGDEEFDHYRIESRMGDDDFAFLRSFFASDTTLTDSQVAGTDTTWSYRVVAVTESGSHRSEPVDVKISLPGANEAGVNGFFRVSNLASLDELAEAGGESAFVIRGSLWISGFQSADLTGLENLATIYGDLTVSGSDGLLNLKGLDNLRVVHGNLEIDGNDGLESLRGLGGLETVGGLLYIVRNGSLEDLTGLDNLRTVSGGMRVQRNDALRSFDGLTRLERVESGIGIFGNESLFSLRGAENLRHVDGATLRFNPALGDLALFRGVTSVDGLEITSLVNLRNLDGLQDVTGIEGSLRIAFNDQLTSLSGLDNLESIEDSLTVQNNDALQTLEGLGSLRSVGGNFTMRSLPQLVSLSSLQNLVEIGGNLSILACWDLVTLDGLESLTRIGGSLEITANGLLLEIAALSGLTEIGSDLQLGAGLRAGNPSLVSIEGLTNLTRIGGELILYYNEALASLEPLGNLTSINGFQLVGNDAVTSLEPLRHLFTELEGSLVVSGNDGLSNFDVFGDLDRLGGTLSLGGPALTQLNFPILEIVGGDLRIGGTVELLDLQGLESLTTIGGELSISGTEGLISLDGLANLQSLGRLWLSGNNSLSDIQALRNLQSLSGLRIFRNPSLTDLTGLEGVTLVEQFFFASSFSGDLVPTGGQITIDQNDNLETLAGLENVTKIEGSLRIIQNPALREVGLSSLAEVASIVDIAENQSLANLDGLGSLADVGGWFRIIDNQSLSSVGGLASLERVADDLTIDRNPVLTELGEFPSLETVGSLFIWGNESLPDRVAVALVDRFIAAGSVLTGNASAGNNKPDPVLVTDVRLSRDMLRISTTLGPPDPQDLTKAPLIVESLFDLSRERTLDTIEWDADVPPGTGIEIRTRTGSMVNEANRFFLDDGQEVTEEQYHSRINRRRQGDIISYLEPGSDWTDWTEPYGQTGAAVDHPPGQRYVQIQVTYTSTDPDVVPTLHEVRILFSPE